MLYAYPIIKWNYPRSRGEKFNPFFFIILFLELPPLARGKVGACGRYWGSMGITPARAGKRILFRHHSPFVKNYPRSRGEKRFGLVLARFALELPPLARGKGAAPDSYLRIAGITPARAGKSLNDLRFWASVSFFHAGSYLTVCRLQGAYLCLVTHHLSSPTQPLTLASVSSFCGLVLQLRPG